MGRNGFGIGQHGKELEWDGSKWDGIGREGWHFNVAYIKQSKNQN